LSTPLRKTYTAKTTIKYSTRIAKKNENTELILNSVRGVMAAVLPITIEGSWG